MTGNHAFAENVRDTERSKGNLGQKKAEEEKSSDEKLEHMGEDAHESTEPKQRKDKSKKR